MTGNAALTDFEWAAVEPEEPDPPSLEDRLLEPVSTDLGLRLIPGQGDPFYMKNRGEERYLFRDEHDRWFIIQPSAKDSEDEYIRWVFLPDNEPLQIARIGIEQRTVIGYDYVRRSEAPEPVESTATAMFLTARWEKTTYECGACGDEFAEPIDHALHCWEEHPWIPKPGQVRLDHEE